MFTLGRLALLLLTVGASAAAVATLVAPLIARGDLPTEGRLATVTRLSLMSATIGGWIAVATLAAAFAASDWRFAYVTDHARPDVAWPLRVGGLWAGPEGSLLLWTTMTATAAVIADRLDRRSSDGTQGSGNGNRGDDNSSDDNSGPTGRRFRPIAVGVAAGHAIITTLLANPFESLATPPAGGTGLQPVLEHPAMVWHPPILYAGLIALMVPADLILSSAHAGSAMTQAAVRSMHGALALLTAGLATGANWAYVELGWGGYWAWDPIENAGLIAWLAAVSILHRVTPGATARRSIAAAAVLPAVGALWATTITRTGVLSSVHSFADQPRLRAALLVVAGLVTVVAAAAAATPAVTSINTDSNTGSGLRSRGSSPVAAGVILAVTALVAIGTYQPAFESLLGDDAVITGPGFYGTVLWPLVVIGGVARVLSGKVSSASTATVVVGALAAMAIAGSEAGIVGLTLAAVGGAVVATVVVAVKVRATTGTGDSPRVDLGASLAHLGVGVLLIGVGGALASTTDTVQVPVGVVTPVEPGAGAAGFEIRYDGATLQEGSGVRRAVASVTVEGRRLEPALISFVRNGATSVETATDRGWLTDTQVSLVDADAERAVLRVSRQPRMAFVWLGAVLMTAGFAAGAATGGTDRPTAHREPLSTTPRDA